MNCINFQRLEYMKSNFIDFDNNMIDTKIDKSKQDNNWLK